MSGTHPNHDPGPGGGGGGGGSSSKTNPSSSALPATSTWAGGRNGSTKNNNRMRSFEEILEDATSNRNILEIILKKNVDETNPENKPANLNFTHLGELLFDHLKIKQDDCIRFNFLTHRYDTRDVLLKPEVNLDPYIKVIPNFYGHTVTTRKQSTSGKYVRVQFRNVPTNVPDEEILHLCSFYGSPQNNKVEYEKLSVDKLKGCVGSIRYVNMIMKPGMSLSNYYWMEGPLPGDQGCRITVLHRGQERQCSHCLKTADNGCPALAESGKACKDMNTKITKMADYMAEVKRKTGYESLKAAYTKKFPSGLGNPKVFENPMDEEPDDDSDPQESNAQESKEKIKNLEKEFEDYRNEADQKLHQAKRQSDLAKNKIKASKQGLDMFLAENIQRKSFDQSDSTFKFLVMEYSNLLNTPEHYNVNQETCEVNLEWNLFLMIEEAYPEHKDTFDLFKTNLKKKIYSDISIRFERRLSIGQTPTRSRSNSVKRKSISEDDNLPKSKINKPSSLPLKK